MELRTCNLCKQQIFVCRGNTLSLSTCQFPVYKMTTVSRVAQFLTKFPNRNPNKILKNPNFNFHRTLTRMSQNPQNYSQTSNGGDDKHRINHFVLSSSSALKIQKGDITEWSIDGATDAIVNAANERMLGGGGVDGAIHRAAGPELRAACHSVPEVRPGVRCPTGEAKITPAFRLPVSHVIHTVGPIYNTHDHPEVLLRSSYRNCLRLAKENNIQYIAFPAISCGVYQYPIEEAATIALSTVKEFSTDFKEVHFILFSDDIYKVWVEKASTLL